MPGLAAFEDPQWGTSIRWRIRLRMARSPDDGDDSITEYTLAGVCGRVYMRYGGCFVVRNTGGSINAAFAVLALSAVINHSHLDRLCLCAYGRLRHSGTAPVGRVQVPFGGGAIESLARTGNQLTGA
jgi:hypothetical protein